MGWPWACTYSDLGVRPLHLEEDETPNVVRWEHWRRRNNQEEQVAEVRLAPRCEAYKNERKVSEQRLKRRGEAAVNLLGKVLAHHWLILAGGREVNDGENEGGMKSGEKKWMRDKERQNEGLYRCRGRLICPLLEWLIERKGGRNEIEIRISSARRSFAASSMLDPRFQVDFIIYEPYHSSMAPILSMGSAGCISYLSH